VTNAGVGVSSWTKLTNSPVIQAPAISVAAHRTYPQLWLVVGTAADDAYTTSSTSGVWVSVDAGASWQPLFIGLYPSRILWRLTPSVHDADRFYASMYGGGLMELVVSVSPVVPASTSITGAASTTPSTTTASGSAISASPTVASTITSATGPTTTVTVSSSGSAAAATNNAAAATTGSATAMTAGSTSTLTGAASAGSSATTQTTAGSGTNNSSTITGGSVSSGPAGGGGDGGGGGVNGALIGGVVGGVVGGCCLLLIACVVIALLVVGVVALVKSGALGSARTNRPHRVNVSLRGSEAGVGSAGWGDGF